jgi:septal ring factor EnvC (AmiA/AmiB activator)
MQKVRWDRDDAKKQRREAEAELERVRSENASQKEIIEELRRDVAQRVSEHAELGRLRTEVAMLVPRVTEQAAEIKRLTQIGCRWKAHEQRAAELDQQQGALAELYEYRYYRRRDHPDLVRRSLSWCTAWARADAR